MQVQEEVEGVEEVEEVEEVVEVEEVEEVEEATCDRDVAEYVDEGEDGEVEGAGGEEGQQDAWL